MTDGWLNEAARMPVAFAQVREDPRVDAAVLHRLVPNGNRRGMMIASGGCTAAVLMATGWLRSLDLVDANPAQLALTRLKLHLLEHAEPNRRRAPLGHSPSATRREELLDAFRTLGLPDDVLGPLETVAALGPDHAGRYELLFARLRQAMGELTDAWPDLLTSPDSASAVAPGTPRGRVFDEAFDTVMALDNLIALFGRAATQNAVRPFARHFACQTRVALASSDAADNPFLWQLLVGRFAGRGRLPDRNGYDWLSLPRSTSKTRVTFTHAMMADALAGREAEYDFVHLSNILDWLTPAEATDVLDRAHRAMRPGGLVVIRQLNSMLDLPALGPQFDWQTAAADALHAGDRSFFYRRLHLGRRP